MGRMHPTECPHGKIMDPGSFDVAVEDCRECDLEADQWREDIAERVIGHIDTMYPKMWEGVPKTARLSIRNTILNALKRES